MKRATILLLIVAVCFSLYAENFTVSAYDITISVNEDYSMHVKERILTDFTSASHGIYRDIQYRFPNPNGNFADPVRADVSSFRSNTPFEEEKEDGYYRFYLGDENTLVTGEQEYVIEYDYALNRDLYDTFDEFYYNLISPAWDTPIWNITYSVSFPKAVDREKIAVSIGDEGATITAPFTLSEDGKTVSGSQSGLRSNGALTLRVEMDEGYWTGLKRESDDSSRYLHISIIISLTLLLLTLLIWFLFGRDLPYSKSSSPFPPEKFSPMEVRLILEDGTGRPERDLCAMLMYWADKGCVGITAKEEKKATEYSIKKLSALPECSTEIEKSLFSIIFKKDVVTLTSICESKFLDEYYSKVKKEYEREFEKGEKRLKRKRSNILEGILLAAFLVLAVTDGVFLAKKFQGLLSIIFILLLVVLFFTFAITGYMYQTRSSGWKRAKRTATLSLSGTVWLIITVLVLLIANKTFLNKPDVIYAIFASTMATAIGSFMAAHVEQRTVYGHDIYEKCLDFRRYIEECEDHSSETFTRLMPYAIALNRGNALSKKFENAVHSRPEWYEGKYHDQPWMFYVILHNSFSQSYSKSTGSVSSSSSSVHAGGGFSGGGGGSW